MNNIKGYIFDYGGTLDTGGCHWGQYIWHAYEQQHIPVSEQDYRQAYVNVERMLGTSQTILVQHNFRQTLQLKIGLQLHQLSLPSSYLNPLVDVLYRQVCQHTHHSLTVLSQLPQPKVLVSNFYGNLSTVLDEFHLTSLFTSVVESAAVGIRKPSPDIFKMGIDALRLLPHEIAVVGDSIKNDILPAQQLGCQTIWLCGEQWTAHPDATAIPDRIVYDIAALLQG